MGTVYRRGRIWWIKYYINGRPIIGALPFDAFKQVIDEELARGR